MGCARNMMCFSFKASEQVHGTVLWELWLTSRDGIGKRKDRGALLFLRQRATSVSC